MTKHTPLQSFFGLALMLAFTACDDNEPTRSNEPSTAQFAQDQLTFSEHESEGEISLLLNQTAALEGIISISVASLTPEGFTTSPAAIDGIIQLPVQKGQGELVFSFSPVDNTVLDENRKIDFSISHVTEGLLVGNQKTLSVIIVDNESHAMASFQSASGSTFENTDSPTTIGIAFSHTSPGTGSIEISLNSDDATYGVHYTTEPVAVNGKVTLPVETGANQVDFKVVPLNDQLFNGDRNITYTISKTYGAIIPGQAINNTLKIKDDELLGKSKGYTTGGGGWGYKREYQYNEQGQVSKIVWEQTAPGNHLSGTYSYEYDASGKVIKMTEFDLTETIYTWENGKIVKAESFRDGVLKKYELYGYDQAGNVGEVAQYFRQANGELKLSLLFVYLYWQDGNLYKQLSYSPAEDPEEHHLIATKTFESYSTKENPFSTYEILPNQSTQPNLPLSYRLETNGSDILYQFTYQYNADGNPTIRTATSSTGSEVTYYEYY